MVFVLYLCVRVMLQVSLTKAGGQLFKALLFPVNPGFVR